MSGPRVALVGASRVPPELLAALTPDLERVGRALGRRGALVFTGACGGFPLVAGRAAAAHGATVLGCSPARSLAEHAGAYDSPTEGCDDLLFVGNGLSARQEFMIRQVGLVCALGGNAGTLCELLTAIKEQRPILAADDVGDIASVVRFALEKLTVYPAPRISWTRLADIPDALASWEAS